MSRCFNCGEEIILEGKETHCHNCNQIFEVPCCNCHEIFKVIDKESNKKLVECKWCGYWHCIYCNSCANNCLGIDYNKKVRELIPTANYEQAQKVVDFFESIIIKKPHRICDRNIPRTYAKKDIKEMLCRMSGKKTRDEADTQAFITRYEELLSIPLEREITITQSREKGTYGKEYRTVLYLLVCEGKFKIIENEIVIGGKKIVTNAFKRIEEEKCPHLNKDKLKLMVKKCGECETVYPSTFQSCPDLKCVYINNTKHSKKGELRKLSETNSNIQTCRNINEGFKKIEDKNGERELDE